jgi:hypothetical protein
VPVKFDEGDNGMLMRRRRLRPAQLVCAAALFVGACCIALPVGLWFVAEHLATRPAHSNADPKVAADERVADYTFWLTVFTAILSGVSIAQGYFLWSANSTNLTIASAAKTSSDLARDEFIASHRPELKLHFPRLLDFDQRSVPEDQPARVEFGIINVGTSAGTVTGSAVYLEYLFPIAEDLPYLPELRPNDVIANRSFEVGATDTYTVTGDKWSGLNRVGAEHTGKDLYLSGWIVYEDVRKNPRTTYFCRVYNSELERFTPVDDPECEQTY